MTLRVTETVERTAGRDHGKQRLQICRVEEGDEPMQHILGASPDCRALHLSCDGPDDLDGIDELGAAGLDYIAVSLGGGLTGAPEWDALLQRFSDTAASTTTPLVWQTSRGSIGQNLLSVRDALHARPDLRIALDYPEAYCAHEMLLGVYGPWKKVLHAIAPHTLVMISGDGDAERDPWAPRHGGVTAAPLRWLYASRQRRATKTVEPTFVSLRSAAC